MIVVTVTPMFPISSIIPMLSIIPMSRNISMWNYPMFAISVVPSMFWAVIGVYTTVVDIVATEHAPWILRDLISDRRMVSQEIPYFVVLIEISAVVN